MTIIMIYMMIIILIIIMIKINNLTGVFIMLYLMIGVIRKKINIRKT